MSLPQNLQDARAIDEWKASRAHELFVEAIEQWRVYYLAQSGNNEYAAVIAANRCQAFQDLTNSLDALSVVSTEETQPEAETPPKPSIPRRTRVPPQTI
jgi:hypothetical protein